jgi:hypothetical protein
MTETTTEKDEIYLFMRDDFERQRPVFAPLDMLDMHSSYFPD